MRLPAEKPIPKRARRTWHWAAAAQGLSWRNFFAVTVATFAVQLVIQEMGMHQLVAPGARHQFTFRQIRDAKRLHSADTIKLRGHV